MKMKIAGVIVLCLMTGIIFAEDKPYTVNEAGEVDKGTYNGYRRFHSICMTCHGKDALGSTIAPNLIDSFTNMTYEEFKITVTNGRTVEVAGQTRVMPSFKVNKDIMKYLDDIYAYLRARSDGAIGIGRPKKMKKKKKLSIK